MEKLKFLQSKTFMIIVSFVGLYLLSTGASLAIFSYLKETPGVKVSLDELEDARSKIAQLPKTEECPINGAMFSKVERDIWESRRPITAVIENHAESRPHSGVSRADVVYEMVAEGGITRFLGIFYCGVAFGDVTIAPVRSARIYLVNLAAGYGDKPLFVHVGGANRLCGDCPRGIKPVSQVAPIVDAVGELMDLGWRVPKGNDFDTTYDSGFPVFWRDYERLGHPIATEHTMTSSSDRIYEQASQRGLNFEYEGEAWDVSFKPWTFTKDQPSSPEYDTIKFGFWSNASDYDVSWKYDSASNSYVRSVGGKQDVDMGFDNDPITAKNVVLIFVTEKGPVDSEKHMYYEVIGNGDALVFQNGQVVEAEWEKETNYDRMVFTDSKGAEIPFVRGQIWIEILPKGNEVEY